MQSLQLTLLALLVTSLTAAVQLSNGTNVTINGNQYANFAPNETMSTGFVWTRKRSLGGFNRFGEYYSLVGSPICAIKCAPFSKPVMSNNRLYCQRDLSAYQANFALNTDGNAFKSFCVPNIEGSADSLCYYATYSLSLTVPRCEKSTLQQHAWYGSESAYYDCCFNDDALSLTTNTWTDSEAILI